MKNSTSIFHHALRAFDNLVFSWPKIFLALLLLFLLVLGWSLAVLAGFANVYFSDTAHLLEIGLQILFYATPIIWPAKMMQERGLGWLVDFNPMASLLGLLRRPILDGQMPEMQTYVISGVTVFVACALALTALTTLQRRVIFHL